MHKLYTSAVVIIPPEEIWPPIQGIRTKYDRQISRWMPHITLLYPFRPENEYITLEKEFTEKCKSIEPFQISLKDFHYFNHGKQRYTLWLKPEPVELIRGPIDRMELSRSVTKSRRTLLLTVCTFLVFTMLNES